MSAHTMYVTTCNICEKIGNVLYRSGKCIMDFCESAGRARAASELSRRGMYKEARYLMIGDNNDSTKN